MSRLDLPSDFKKAFHLPIEQIVYVPSTKGADQKISDKEFKKRVREVEEFLSRRFGGKTSIKGVGGYFSDDKNKIINEDIIKVTSYSTQEAFNKNKKVLVAKLKYWRKKWSQEAMGIEIEGDMYYI